MSRDYLVKKQQHRTDWIISDSQSRAMTVKLCKLARALEEVTFVVIQAVLTLGL